MSHSTTIGVCSVGDPQSPGTWSGTPAHICRELDAAGRLGPTLDSSGYAGPRLKRVVQRASRFYYRCPVETWRGRLERRLSARYAAAFFERRRTTDVLHTGASDLPLSRPSRAARHYILCDSTWDLRRQAGAGRFCSERLGADAELLEQRAFSQVTHIFSISEYVRRNLVDHYGIAPDRITVVGTGRGAIKPYDGAKDYASREVLFVAKERFEEKGGALLLEGFRLARQQDPRIRLTLAGDERYRALAGDTPNVEVFGYVPLDCLQDLFNRAALFAMPALHEPWGLVYLEALSCRTPILGLNRNALPELTQHGRFGICLDQATPGAVADALLDASRDPQRLARMGAEGQTYSLTYTWERTVARMLERIDRCSR